ncbi:hypothetical protein [Candidatus Cardinium hertigii]|uniref:hypothetical protein n=1 Tax=Candidatus Cardinium hertigii TaxID=247481 RepID=UPI001FA9AB70|nr:hypothetical protein [Candidatus Cardinium hertigii]
MAHVSTASLGLVDEILAYMPKGPKDVILVGSQHASGKYNLDIILKNLAKYNHIIDIIQSYCGNTGSLLFGGNDNSEIIMTSFYHINTNFGNVIVDPKSLKITTDSPEGKIPPGCKVQHAYSAL